MNALIQIGRQIQMDVLCSHGVLSIKNGQLIIKAKSQVVRFKYFFLKRSLNFKLYNHEDDIKMTKVF